MADLEYLKKSRIGGYKIVDSSEDWTHFAIEYQDLQNLINERTLLENELEETKEKLKEAEKNNETYMNKISEVVINAEKEKKEADRKLREAGRLVEEAEEIRQEQRVEIENIRRIYKETINAARNLKPKKEHTGYCVLSSTEKTYRWKRNNSSYFLEEVLWETILETPYTVDFEPNNIKEMFKDELFTSPWKIAEIGINGSHFANEEKDVEGKYDELMYDKYWRENDKYKDYNIILEPQIKANYRTGYWEIIFYHTKPLDTVPATWRKSNYK